MSNWPPSPAPGSTTGGLEPEAQQLRHADAAVGGIPGARRVPHLQIQEVTHRYIITSTCCALSYTTPVYIDEHIIHYWWHQMSSVPSNQSQSYLENPADRFPLEVVNP